MTTMQVTHLKLLTITCILLYMQSLESSLTDLKEICAHCLRQCERAFETVHPIFNGYVHTYSLNM